MGQEDRAKQGYEEALVILERLTEENPRAQNLLQSLALTYAALGRAEDADRVIARLKSMTPLDTEPYFGATIVQVSALVYIKLGNYDAAIEELDSILAIPSVVSIPLLELDPRWKPLWNRPGFRELVDRYGETGSSADPGA